LEEEFQNIVAARIFFGRYGALHLLSGTARPEQLTFDMQVAVPRPWIPRTPLVAAGVRKCSCQAYFRHATEVGELTRIFLTKLGSPACLSRTLAGAGSFRAVPSCADGYEVVGGRLAVTMAKRSISDKL